MSFTFTLKCNNCGSEVLLTQRSVKDRNGLYGIIEYSNNFLDIYTNEFSIIIQCSNCRNILKDTKNNTARI
jgi:hypothetical protein